MNKSDYKINFSIPIGEIGMAGARGPQGDIGPTGPYALEETLFVQYKDTTTSSMLSISDSTIWPQKSTSYTVNQNEFIINQNGNYEFTLNGKLKKDTIVTIVSVDKNGVRNEIKIFHPTTEEVLFTWKDILYIKESGIIRIYTNMIQATSGVESMGLLVKKITL